MKKWQKITYWVATIWLCAGMVATGVQQLMQIQLEGALSPPGVFGIVKLGYPVYVLTIIGIWKMLGVIALLIPKYPLVKEWAYAGFFFLLTGALYSHIAVEHPMKELFPSVFLLMLLILSWHYRPASRKIATTLSNV